MKFRNDRFLLRIIVLMLVIMAVVSMLGCASMTEEYWRDRYDAMTAEEIEAAKAKGGELIPVCNLTDCIFVWVY